MFQTSNSASSRKAPEVMRMPEFSPKSYWLHIVFRRSVRAAFFVKEQQTLELMKDVCREYVVYKLRKRNLVSK